MYLKSPQWTEKETEYILFIANSMKTMEIHVLFPYSAVISLLWSKKGGQGQFLDKIDIPLLEELKNRP